jgi:hypothetical protein
MTEFVEPLVTPPRRRMDYVHATATLPLQGRVKLHHISISSPTSRLTEEWVIAPDDR